VGRAGGGAPWLDVVGLFLNGGHWRVGMSTVMLMG
jgi:hypothetical protein